MLIPAGAGVQRIEEIRRRHDPQASQIPAHVTLVFPFESPITGEELRSHIRTALSGQPAFRATFSGVTAEDDGYILLHVDVGHDAVVTLHDRLYSGPLLRHRSTTHTYRPHMTLGRVKNPTARAHVVDAVVAEQLELTTHVKEVVAFNVSDRLVEFTCSLAT